MGASEFVPSRPQLRPTSSSPAASRDAAGEHLLVSYSSDEALVATAVGRLAPALEDGEAAVVIAGRDRGRDLTDALAGLGLDVAGAVRAEQLVSLDADTLLSACTSAGVFDADRARRMLLQLVLRAAAGKREVHVVSELAPLLWSQRAHLAAVAVEVASTELVASWPLSLLCAYPNAFAGQDRRPGYAAVCEQHTEILPDLGGP